MFIVILAFASYTLPLGCPSESPCEPIGLFEPTLGLIPIECHAIGYQMAVRLPDDSVESRRIVPLWIYGFT